MDWNHEIYHETWTGLDGWLIFALFCTFIKMLISSAKTGSDLTHLTCDLGPAPTTVTFFVRCQIDVFIKGNVTDLKSPITNEIPAATSDTERIWRRVKLKHCLRSIITPVRQINFTSSMWIIAAIRDHFFFPSTNRLSGPVSPWGSRESGSGIREGGIFIQYPFLGGERNVDLSPLPISYMSTDRPTDNDGEWSAGRCSFSLRQVSQSRAKLGPAGRYQSTTSFTDLSGENKFNARISQRIPPLLFSPFPVRPCILKSGYGTNLKMI